NVTLNNVTFSGNSATNGGSITYFAGGNSHFRLKNVLLANAQAGGNCDFHLDPDTSKKNLSSDNTCHFGGGRDSIKIKLGPLETNGGATLTHRLLPGSRAIDKGVSIKTIHI